MSYGLRFKRPRRYQWVMGQGKATKKLGADAGDIKPDGEWKKFDSEKELQSRDGFETMNCTNFAILLALMALAKFKKYTLFPDNCSERYSGIGTHTTPFGNDMWQVAETIATKIGAIHESRLPWDNSIREWDVYYSPDPLDEGMIAEGQEVLRAYEIEPEWVFHEGHKLSPSEKRTRLQAALKRGTVVVTVRAWEEKKGVYTKQVGAIDNHLVWLPHYVGERPEIRDQYKPFYKQLEPEYDFNRAIVFFMRPNPSKALPHEVAFLKWLLRTGQYAKVIPWIARNLTT